MSEIGNQSHLLSPRSEAHAFRRMRWRLISAHARQLLREARFRVALAVSLSGVLWFALLALALDGLRFIDRTITHRDLYFATIEALFGMFFAALFVMLVFSSGILLYGSLFRSAEVNFLLTLPVRTERVFAHKLAETVVFSSWGFLLLGSPLLIAWGIHARAEWVYYALLLPFIATFVYIPVALGAVLCLLVLRLMPRQRMQVLLTVGGILIAVAAAISWSVIARTDSTLFTAVWFREVLDRFQGTQGRLLPSWWLTAGLLDSSFSASSRFEALLFLALLAANALFFRLLAIEMAARLFRPILSAMSNIRRVRRRPQTAPIDRLASAMLWFASPAVRLLVIKDLRIFRRDPAQWSQFLIFVGLLLLYFLNIRRFNYVVAQSTWVNLISFLNLTVIGLLMSTFTTRFIFPMVSMEGRRFWLLGLMPVSRDTILMSKFIFSLAGSIIPCAALILLSDVMLRIGWGIMLSHQLTCLVLCTGLSGIAVGLGARLPNLREQSPSRIAAGFGGTLNLVLSTVFIVAVVVLTAVPCHFYYAADATSLAGVTESWRLQFWIGLGTIAAVVLGAACTVLPLWIGRRAFRRIEF